jgi:hypothetical protein
VEVILIAKPKQRPFESTSKVYEWIGRIWRTNGNVNGFVKIIKDVSQEWKLIRKDNQKQ